MGNNISYKKDFGLVVIGAILFTASFLWIEFLAEVENKYFPKNKGLSGRFLYTFVITLFLIIIAVSMRKYFGLNYNNPYKDDDNKNNGPPNSSSQKVTIARDTVANTENTTKPTTLGDTGISIYGMDDYLIL